MRILVHISDLHFGKVDNETAKALIEKIRFINPHLIAVSGDLTQRARSSQFIEAAHFLERLPFPKLVVPGNHDVPLYNLFARFLFPFRNYQKFINPNLEPIFEDEEIIAVGLCTPKSFTIAEGKLRNSSLNKFPNYFKKDKTQTRIVVSHHPLDIQKLLPFAPDILLAGHLHKGSISSTMKLKIGPHRSLLVIQGGTAISTRHRGEDGNSFNVVTLESSRIAVEKFQWHSAQFKSVEKKMFNLAKNGWDIDQTG